MANQRYSNIHKMKRYSIYEIGERKKTKKVILQNNYKTYRNILNKTIRLAKSNYCSAKFEEAKGNIKDTWK